MNGLRHKSSAVFTLWLLFGLIHPAQGEPYIPSDDRQVLEQLPRNRVAPATHLLRADLSRHPDNLEVAAQLVTRYIEAGRFEGDPRLFGRAQALLSPWWDQPAPPPRVLLLRAIIRQNAHEFDAALADLDAVLLAQPTNVQAWLVKASILQVQGRYDDARRACQPLTRLAARALALTCVSDIAGLTGQAAQSRRVLQWIADRSSLTGRERQWALTALAELAARTGEPSMAEHYFIDAGRAGPHDQYLAGAYADFLLDQGRAREVLNVLQKDTRSDGLLLRLALAEQALNLPAAKDHTMVLAARFAAGRERGTLIHLREEARFTLMLLADPPGALTLAQANWAVQKEPWDARVLLESALAVGNRASAQPVLEWMATNHIEDTRLQALAARFTKAPS